MGLKNAPSIFQRLMDWIFADLKFVDPYIDDIIIGSTRATEEEAICNHERDVQLVLQKLAEYELLVSRSRHNFL